MDMTSDKGHASGAHARTAISTSLSGLLGLIQAAAHSAGNDASSLDHLVAFRKKAQMTLSTRDLTIAFRECLLDFDPSSLTVKVFITDWLSDLVRTSNHVCAPTQIILELSKVSAQLNLSRQEAEEWMSLLVSLCGLVDACLGAVRRLGHTALASFLKDHTCMKLASIILETGKQVFNHVDRNQTKRERSHGYLEWNQRTLNLTKNFLEFTGEQVQQNRELRTQGRDMTIGEYAEEARTEYAYLNLAFKCIVTLVPLCEQDSVIRLETQKAIRVACDGILGSFLDIYKTCARSSEVAVTYTSRRWTLARFYTSHLRSLLGPLLKEICGSGTTAAACRGLLRYFLFFMRSRFISSDAIRKNHPAVQSEIVKFVSNAEEIVVSALLGSARGTDDDKYALIREFAMAPGPRATFELTEPLSECEWEVGRLKFLLKVASIFDEFSPALQLQLYPADGGFAQSSLLSLIVDCVNTVGLREFGPTATDGTGQENSDIYFRILSELCTFAFLMQPKQFARLQVEMIGLLLGQSELWSLIARDWWACVSDRMGQAFTLNQIQILVELLATLPTGRASQKISCLLESMVPLLNEQSQLALAKYLIAAVGRKSHRNTHTLLSCFPYGSLDISNLDLVVDCCADSWREACDLLSDERLVLETFYSMHQPVTCLASICMKAGSSLTAETRCTFIGWSVDIIGGAQELLALVQDDQRSLAKISRTIEDIFAFLQYAQPIQSAELIQVLDTISSWERLPREKRPLSRLSMARFLASCSVVEITDESEMAKIKVHFRTVYDTLLRDPEWTVAHAALIMLCKETRYPQLLEACIPEAFRHTVQKLIEQEREGSTVVAASEHDPAFWSTISVRTKYLWSRQFATSTVSDLQTLFGTRPSIIACFSALTTVARYMEAPRDGEDDGDDELRSRVVVELAKVQVLDQGHKYVQKE